MRRYSYATGIMTQLCASCWNSGTDFSKRKEISEKESVNCQPVNYCCPWSTVITAKRLAKLTVPLVNSSKHVFLKLISLTCTAPLPGGLASSKWSNILIGEMKDKRDREERETNRLFTSVRLLHLLYLKGLSNRRLLFYGFTKRHFVILMTINRYNRKESGS